MSEREFTEIGKLGKVVTGKTPSKNTPEQWGNKALFVTPSDFNSDEKYILNTTRKISDEGIEKFKTIKLPPNSVMVSCIGSDMGKVTINQEIGITNQQINSIIVNEELYDSDFIYYALKYNYKLLRKFADGGSTMPILNKSTFESILLSIPKEKVIQECYSLPLTLLDKKITLLRQQNQTLEELAQTLFKRWFVEFEFPFDFAQGKPDENGRPYKSSGGKMVESELGEIPEGWRVGLLEELCSKITDGTHSTVKDDPNGKFHLLSCKNIKNGTINVTSKDRLINESTLLQLRKRTQLSVYDLLVTTVGTIGKVAMIRDNSIPYELQRSVAIIRPDINKISPEFLYQFSRSIFFQHQAISRSEGSVQTCLFLGAIKGIELVIPENKIMKNSEGLFKAFYSRIHSNNKEIQTLTQLRDTLLPKLMSGELRVKM